MREVTFRTLDGFQFKQHVSDNMPPHWHLQQDSGKPTIFTDGTEVPVFRYIKRTFMRVEQGLGSRRWFEYHEIRGG